MSGIEVIAGPPLRFVAGETVKWQESAGGFPAEDGWQLTASFSTGADGTGRKNFASYTSLTATGDTYDFVIESTDTAEWQAAYPSTEYLYTLFAARTTPTTERRGINQARVEVFLDLAAATGGTDIRTHNERVLFALQCAMEGRAKETYASYSIEGVSIAKLTADELAANIATYSWRVYNERRKNRLLGAPIRTVSRGSTSGLPYTRRGWHVGRI